ncbi:aminoacyl-histidine dipeptidase [Butyricicoccus sp.]|uniref:aminoacyl-histidine dipeptidase n=1 Tax=Butyricicoccus sp. TaxID=2049021 RepID=UPI003F15083F
MAVLENLEPKRVFGFFEQMCAIPHGSGNTKAISDWLKAFADARGLEVHQDSMGNVIIIKEASAGYEQAEPVIFQGHMDMVCEKAPGCTKDMETEGLDLATDGDTVYAEGTTLGGDDGIAVAMALAILDDPEIQHPRFEAVFTVDEEIGMLGAVDIDVSPLKGRRMMNLDSENEGVFTVSCAGGNISRCVLPLTRAPFDGTVLRLTVGGFQGGHSGVEIDKGRGNSNMLMGRVLCAVNKATDMRLICVDGGLKDNAIAQETVAVISAADVDAVKTVCAQMQDALKNEYRSTDAGVFTDVGETEADLLPMDAASTHNTVCLLACAPNGIQAMSHEIDGLVQTSLNLGVLKTEEQQLSASFCVRSSVETQKQMLVDRLSCLMSALDGSVEVSGDYPGWEFQKDSALRDLMAEVYTEQYGEAPKIEAIHAGVECGMFAGKLPGLDCVSFGPDLTEIHTFRERMHIASVQRTWKLVVEVLRRMK